jgi:aubergine-like protein
MRSNYQLMSAVAKYTRISPAERIKKLLTFNRRLNCESNVSNELKNWNLKLDTQLVNITGRVFPSDIINYGENATSQVPPNVLWTKDMKNKHLTKCGVLNQWALIVPYAAKRDCQVYIQNLVFFLL